MGEGSKISCIFCILRTGHLSCQWHDLVYLLLIVYSPGCDVFLFASLVMFHVHSFVG